MQSLNADFAPSLMRPTIVPGHLEPGRPDPEPRRLRLTLGRDIATVSLVYKVRGREMTGRQTQTWVRFPDVGWKVVHAHVSMIAEEPIQ